MIPDQLRGALSPPLPWPWVTPPRLAPCCSLSGREGWGAGRSCPGEAEVSGAGVGGRGAGRSCAGEAEVSAGRAGGCTSGFRLFRPGLDSVKASSSDVQLLSACCIQQGEKYVQSRVQWSLEAKWGVMKT